MVPTSASVDAGVSHVTSRRIVASPKLAAEVSTSRVSVHAFSADFGLRTESFGRDTTRVSLASARFADEGDRVHLHRDDVAIDEWWRSTAGGLEQGFDVARAPAGDGPLCVHVALEGGLRAELARRDVVLRDAHGAARASMRGLTATDARGHVLPAWFTVAGAAVELHVDDRGAEYPVQIDPVVGTETELAPADLGFESEFGSSLSLQGARLLVGASGQLVGGSTPGAAYVFDRDATTGLWSQTTELDSTDGVSGDGDGSAVLLEGDTAFVGAPSRAVGTASSVGVVYVFTRGSTGTWSQTQEIMPPVAVDSMSFGTSLAFANATLFVSAPTETIGSAMSAGAVYAFTNGASGWTFESKLTAATPVDSDRLGSSISASVVETKFSGGDECSTTIPASQQTVTVAAGAPNHTSPVNGDANAGAAWLFTRVATSTGAWTELAPVSANDPTGLDYFGSSVALDVVKDPTTCAQTQTLVVGSPYHSTSVSGAGSVYVYGRDPSAATWSLTKELVASDAESEDQLGTAVAISGGVIATSAFNAYSGTIFAGGKLYLFTPSGSAWSQRAIYATDPSLDDQLGNALDFDGTSIVAGAARHATATNASVGVAYVFNPATGLALGGTCANAGDCASGFCVDGVCCDGACTGQCQVCAATGHCQSVDGAAPETGRTPCTFPYKLCVAGACATSCAAPSDCASGATCNASDACVAASSTGSKCAAATDCSTGHCVDGVCCDTACTDTCAACDVTGSIGTCSPVTGPAHGTRSCGTSTGDAQCGLACDGTVTTKCSYATAATACVKTSCSGSQETNEGVCDGAGTCTVTPSDCPGYLKCGSGGACLSGCMSDDDCVARSSCQGGTCTAPRVADCSADNSTSTNQGAVTVCAPYACSDVTGLCNDTCTATSDCGAGAVCDTPTSRCIAQSTAAGGAGGGCAFDGRARGGASWIAIALGLALSARRRDRRR